MADRTRVLSRADGCRLLRTWGCSTSLWLRLRCFWCFCLCLCYEGTVHLRVVLVVEGGLRIRADLLVEHLDICPGGAKGTRTPDPLLAKQVLFQLSYSPEWLRGNAAS